MSQPQINVNVNVGANAAAGQRPAIQLKTNRGLIRLLLLSLITFGIYAIVYYTVMSEDINTIASRHDGKKTMHYCLLFFIIAPITLGIGAIVWMHRLCNRIGGELLRRNLPYSFSAGSFWLWNTVGALILVGPFVFLHKLSKAMNMVCADYNQNG